MYPPVVRCRGWVYYDYEASARRWDSRLSRDRLFFLVFLSIFFLSTWFSSRSNSSALLFSFAFSSTDSRRLVSLRIVNRLWAPRISFLAILLFFCPLLLSNHRFISTHSLFVHSESFALIAEVKWDSKKRSQGCASTPRASLSMNCCKTLFCGLACNESAVKSFKHYVDVSGERIGKRGAGSSR